MERQGNFFSRLRQTKVINEKRFIQERGIHACPALTRWRKITTRSPRICPWEICPMGHRYIVIQGAHVDVVYGKWPGEAGSRSRPKGQLATAPPDQARGRRSIWREHHPLTTDYSLFRYKQLPFSKVEGRKVTFLLCDLQ